MKKGPVFSLLCAALVLIFSSCAPVSPSIDRKDYNAARAARQKDADPQGPKAPSPSIEKVVFKTLSIQSEIKTEVISSQSLDETIKTWQEPAKDQPDDAPAIISRLSSDDSQLQKLVQESITIQTGAVFAKKVVIYIGLKKSAKEVKKLSEKDLKDLQVQSWSFTREKELGSEWRLKLSSKTTEEQRTFLSKNIQDLALVIFPFNDQEKAELLGEAKK